MAITAIRNGISVWRAKKAYRENKASSASAASANESGMAKYRLSEMAAGENGQRERNRNNEIMKKKRSAKWRGSEIISKWHGKYRRNKT
jgi:hypothetical protein